MNNKNHLSIERKLNSKTKIHGWSMVTLLNLITALWTVQKGGNRQNNGKFSNFQILSFKELEEKEQERAWKIKLAWISFIKMNALSGK